MAEICVDCFNRIMGATGSEKRFIITRTPEVCEECGQYKRVIIRYKLRYILADHFQDLAENLRHLRNR